MEQNKNPAPKEFIDDRLSPADIPVKTFAQRHDGWTVEKQTGFLRMLATTQSVAAAARSVGMGRQSAYKLRARLRDQPFDAAWRLAVRSATATLAEAAMERALEGVEVPHFYQGQLVATSRRFDERLTLRLLELGDRVGGARRARGPEAEYAQRDLTRLLARIEHGPSEWCDLEDERNFAWGDISTALADDAEADADDICDDGTPDEQDGDAVDGE